jgi:pilus assembly protein CpaB
MAAMLPQGMRAVAVPISAETGVGGFILPNDRVDVLLTRRERSGGQQGQDRFTSETILSTVRVMAIDQTIQERDGEKVVVGRTATLELTPQEAETMALSKQMGEISLALRSLADSKERTAPSDSENSNRKSSVTIVRFGVPAQAPMIGR